MVQLEVLVEEPSAAEALRHLLPKLLHAGVRAKVVNLGSKYKLLKALRDRLAAYRARIENGEDLRIAVVVDRDADDCERLKQQLEQVASAAGLPTKTRPDQDGRIVVLNRIVVEELESWFIGDPAALRAAFPKLPAIAENRSIFRSPDDGGTWEALHRFLKKYGIYKSSYPKIDAARKIAPHLDISRNRSASFRIFCKGIKALVA